MGDPNKNYDYEVRMIVKELGQIRHNALEAAREMALKRISKAVGNETDFFLWVLKYPHHILRENKMMAFAGADRLQDGMRLSFGKPIGTAVRIERQGEILMLARVKKEHVNAAKEALEIASKKIPLDVTIQVVPLKVEAKAQ